MRVPRHVSAALSKGHSLGFSCDPDGTVTSGFERGWGGGAYPPPGYLPWNILEVGNGDTYGYYWPIGQEDGTPLVCTIMHDAWQLAPVASSLDACLRLHLLSGVGDVEELVDAAERFGVEIGDIPIPKSDEADGTVPSLNGPPWTDGKPSGIEYWGVPSAADLLQNDPNCAHLRFVAAKEAIAKRQLDEAENHLSIALAHLPEYSEALALLAQVHRQRQNHVRMADALMEAITSLQCFGASDRKKLLGWLQRIEEGACRGCTDPLWKRRSDLTFVEGVKEKNDYNVFEELIEDYHRLGMGVRAVRLRILSGEWMGRETVSFRERQNWTYEKYRSLLKADLERAGLHQRLLAL